MIPTHSDDKQFWPDFPELCLDESLSLAHIQPQPEEVLLRYDSFKVFAKHKVNCNLELHCIAMKSETC